MQPTIGIVLPCYNEEAVLDTTAKRILNLVQELKNNDFISTSSFIAFIDDGSKDRTWDIIESYNDINPNIKGLKLAKNVGHQNALLAGLLNFKNQADALISLDADLQDDITVIHDMIKAYIENHDVVYGVRNERKTDSFFKRTTAILFYKLMLFMKVDIIYNHADYRLCSKRVLDSLENFKEVNLFLRGIIPTIGFNSTHVLYNRAERFAGESKYPFKKMVYFAWNGITSFSNYPLKIVTRLSFLVFLACLIMLGYALYALITQNTVPGWLSIVLPMYFLGAIMLFSIGVLGEYMGKMYSEIKQRPRYIIEKEI